MIGAVVVLYHPEWDVTYRLIEKLQQQVDYVCLVDNSPHPNKVIRKSSKLSYSHFPENVGIATAQNRGLECLKHNGCRFGLIFDQDSHIQYDFVARMKAHFLSFRKNHNAAAIGPQIVCTYTNKARKPRIQKSLKVIDDNICIVPQIISSGMFLDLQQLQFIGLKKEGLFIDAVDHEWCWRAKDNGFHVAIARNVEMLHRQGDKKRSFMGVDYRVSSPVRLYYQFRNILLLRKYKYVPSYWKYRNICTMPIKFLAMTIVERNRFQRAKYMILGIIHGLFGRQGKIDSPKRAG